MQKWVWVSEWVVKSSQESRNPSSLGNCCFSSGEVALSGLKGLRNIVGEQRQMRFHLIQKHGTGSN